MEYRKDAYLLNQSASLLKLGQDYFGLATDIYRTRAKNCGRHKFLHKDTSTANDVSRTGATASPRELWGDTVTAGRVVPTLPRWKRSASNIMFS